MLSLLWLYYLGLWGNRPKFLHIMCTGKGMRISVSNFGGPSLPKILEPKNVYFHTSCLTVLKGLCM